MVEKEHCFNNLCCGPTVPAMSLVPLPHVSQDVLPRPPFILDRLSLKYASRYQA